MSTICAFLLRHRYFIAGLALLVLMITYTMNGHQLGGDFWSHSAAVRELAANPFSPMHSHFSLDAPTVLYSPYSVGVAFVSRILQIDAVIALSIAGIFNLFLFLYGLRLFVSLLMPDHAEAAAFYSMFFTLVLWGNDAWLKSGFYHLRILGGVLPLPSAFGFSLVLIALSMFIVFVRNNNRVWFIPITIIAIIVIISHPLSFIFLTVGLIALSLGIRRLSFADYGLLVCVFAATLLAAAIWPYAPLLKLIFMKSIKTYSSHSVARTLYQGVVVRTFPALIGIPFLIMRIKSNRWDPLGIMFVLLCFIYACGAVFEKWVFGRMISFIVFVLHISMAGGIAKVESQLDNYCQHVKRKINTEQLFIYIGVSILSAALVWGSKKLLWPNVETTLQLKFIVLLGIVLSSMFLTWFLFRPSGCFCRQTLLFKKFAFFSLILIALLIFSTNDYVRPALSSIKLVGQNNYKQYSFMQDYVGQYDVVLSDLATSLVIPAYGGKVVAAINTPTSVPDQSIRVNDVEDFFSSTATYTDQLMIIRKYRVNFLLLDKSKLSMWPDIAHSFASIGHVIYSDDKFILISLASLKEEKR